MPNTDLNSVGRAANRLHDNSAGKLPINNNTNIETGKMSSITTAERVYDNELPDEVTVVREIRQCQKRHFEPEEIARMTTDYTEHHMTVYQLANKYDCNRTTVSKVLKSNGVDVTIKRMDDKQIEEAKRLYATGLSLKQVGQEMGICESTVRATLTRAGVEMRKPHRYSYPIHPPTVS
ncbi:MAG: hypothetical protein LBS98_01975 [Coriobacteriales bacterium]|nr:hypothetical protein [Coriobacteriales bacterium]